MNPNKIIAAAGQAQSTRHKNCIAIHEAARAAGIYLNKQDKLSSESFKIILNSSCVMQSDDMAYQASDDNYVAKVEGGRFIEELTPSNASVTYLLAKHDDDAKQQWLRDYQLAFDADIINLLVGPLAEAKYVAERDNEPFNHQLVNLNALKNYGGDADIVLIGDYLQNLPLYEQQKNEKLSALFIIAFKFVTNEANWVAISKLAKHLLESKKSIIFYEEVAAIIEQSLDHFQTRRILSQYGFKP
jgi:hypothetical protein